MQLEPELMQPTHCAPGAPQDTQLGWLHAQISQMYVFSGQPPEDMRPSASCSMHIQHMRKASMRLEGVLEQIMQSLTHLVRLLWR